MIPPPHGFASAEDTVGYEKNITFWIGNCAVRYAGRGRGARLRSICAGNICAPRSMAADELQGEQSSQHYASIAMAMIQTKILALGVSRLGPLPYQSASQQI